MTIILNCLCAIALVLTGAVVSGGLRLPPRDCCGREAVPAADEELAALLRYSGEPERRAEDEAWPA